MRPSFHSWIATWVLFIVPHSAWSMSTRQTTNARDHIAVVARTSQLRRKVGGISEKMLIQTLRRLERNGFVSRRAYPEVPPRVEYSLTALGASLSEPITTLDRWVETHLQDIAMAQREFDRHDG